MRILSLLMLHRASSDPLAEELVRFGNLVHAASFQKIEKMGLREMLFLEVLHSAQGPLTVGEVQRSLGVRHAPQMTRILARLEKNTPPFILRSIGLRDRREIEVTITEAGKELLEHYRESSTGKIEELLVQMEIKDTVKQEVLRTIQQLNELLKGRLEGGYNGKRITTLES